MAPPWEEGTKVYIKGPGHMTKMGATPFLEKINFENQISKTQAHFDLYHCMSSLMKLDITVWLSLQVHSLKRVDYPKQICLTHTLSFGCLYCS